MSFSVWHNPSVISWNLCRVNSTSKKPKFNHPWHSRSRTARAVHVTRSEYFMPDTCHPTDDRMCACLRMCAQLRLIPKRPRASNIHKYAQRGIVAFRFELNFQSVPELPSIQRSRWGVSALLLFGRLGAATPIDGSAPTAYPTTRQPAVRHQLQLRRVNCHLASTTWLRPVNGRPPRRRACRSAPRDASRKLCKQIRRALTAPSRCLLMPRTADSSCRQQRAIMRNSISSAGSALVTRTPTQRQVLHRAWQFPHVERRRATYEASESDQFSLSASLRQFTEPLKTDVKSIGIVMSPSLVYDLFDRDLDDRSRIRWRKFDSDRTTGGHTWLPLALTGAPRIGSSCTSPSRYLHVNSTGTDLAAVARKR